MNMHFLADESCDFAIVRALRTEGYDVKAVVECCPGAEDEDVINLAAAENRILLTEDKDFGRLVYMEMMTKIGVILFRFSFNERKVILGSISKLVKNKSDVLQESFTVVQPNRIRIRKLPRR